MQPQQVLLGPFFYQRLDKGAPIFINWTPAQILILKSNLNYPQGNSGNSVDDPSWVCDDSPKNVEKSSYYLILLGIISNIQMNVSPGLADCRSPFFLDVSQGCGFVDPPEDVALPQRLWEDAVQEDPHSSTLQNIDMKVCGCAIPMILVKRPLEPYAVTNFGCVLLDL
jgi:hypothetical protein